MQSAGSGGSGENPSNCEGVSAGATLEAAQTHQGDL